MIAVVVLLQLATRAEMLARGEKLFAQHCSVGYCHGAAGAAGRAPRLRDRKLSRDYLYQATRDGIPKSAMPGWKDRLTDDDIWALVVYIESLSGVTVAPPAPPAATGAVKPHPGRALFLERCAACHAYGGQGTAAGPDIANMNALPASARLVKTVKLTDGETFPALVAAQDDSYVQVWDLTATPPVRRTLERGEVAAIAQNQTWVHPPAGSREQTVAIFAYLRGGPR